MKEVASKYWKIPPEGSAAFVAHMEDVLEIYHMPYDPDYPKGLFLLTCGDLIW